MRNRCFACTMLDNSACLVYNNDTLVALHALPYDKEDPMPRKFLFTKEQMDANGYIMDDNFIIPEI